MKVTAFQGVIENGQIKLPSGTPLPESATVYVLISEALQQSTTSPRVVSPRLAHPEEAALFELEAVEGNTDAVL